MNNAAGSIRSAQVIQVIRTESKAGAGTEDDPNRIVTQYWSTDGKLLAVHDPFIRDAWLPASPAPGQ